MSLGVRRDIFGRGLLGTVTIRDCHISAVLLGLLLVSKQTITFFTSSLELLGNLPEISPQSLISIFTRGLKRSNGVTGVKFSNFQCQIFPGRSRKKALDWKLHVIAQPMSAPRHPILTKIIIFGPRSKREKSVAARQEQFLAVI